MNDMTDITQGEAKAKLINPLLPGFYPDPSICRVGDDFYMVTSSFSYFPGVPVFHSRNLADWEQIGHVLDRPEQLRLNPRLISAGIFAPTIRFHDGIFYMITTNVTYGGNFIVTAEDPAGPWSNPHWIEGAGGIDPSLFWDDDGKAYYTGTTDFQEQGPPMIWISEIDLEEFRLMGERKKIWGGALRGCASPEAPHIYKKDGYYYLMIAEGGTEHFHAVTIARSRSVDGGYEGYAGNPILTHRGLGCGHPIANTGHADLVELKDGSWYMVLLASRPYGGYHKNMGRETFIAPVVWENGWPVVSPGTGKVEWSYPAPESLIQEIMIQRAEQREEFDSSKLAYCWNFLGTPVNHVYKIEDSCLKLKTVRPTIGNSDKTEHMAEAGLEAEAALAFLGRRQQHKSFLAEVKMIFMPGGKETAGITVLQNAYQQLRIEMGLDSDGKRVIRAVRGYSFLEPSLTHRWEQASYQEEVLGCICWETEEVILGIQAKEQDYQLYAADGDGRVYILAEHVDGGFLGSETAGGFVGAYIGMFASGNGIETDNYAAFDWFSYKGTDDIESNSRLK